MRLLKRLPGDTFELTSFDDDHPPPYAILSHTWIKGQEVTFQELEAGLGREKTGLDKIRFCGEQAAVDGLQYFWVDTCCIDKSSLNELSTAINYMFRWYQRASKCYVYLPDVSAPEHDAAAFKITWANAFLRSRWFTRGWTLQELIAPASVQFFSKERKLLGSKISLEHEIQNATGIPISALRGQSLATFSVEERMRWVALRTTTVKEDRVYCLLGIFGVFLPFIPGEGEAYARKRLEEEIQKRQEGRRTEQTYHSDFNAARLETKRPSCAVPFYRDPDFVDRGTLLDELQEKYSARAARVALVGLGGVGKSQLAVELCYRTADRSPETWIFWVHAGSVARLEQSYRDIADQVGIAGRTDAQADVFELVRNWLREKNGKWLLVLDNADDDAIFASLPCTRDQQHLSRYLPPSKHGMVIVTSRSAHATSRLVEDRDTFHLGPMHDSSAQALLLKKLGDKIDAHGIHELAAALEYMPLALVQAAAYIQKRAPHYSVQRYLEEFRRSDKRKARLLSQEAGHLRRNEGAKNSIIVTWQISFEHIRSIRKSAADILSLMSFFDRQGIPKALLHSQSALQIAGKRTLANEVKEIDEEESASESDSDDGFIDDLLLLRDYSFISETTDPGTLEMHSLVQLATQKWLEGRSEAEGWKQQFIGKMRSAFPIGNKENRAICEGLFPHAVIALQKRPRDEESCKDWAALLHNAAWYAYQRGPAETAVALATAAMKTRHKILGAESDMTLSSMAMLELATDFQVLVTETRKTKLGADHPSTLNGMASLASTYRNQGRWEEAEKLEVQVMETRKTKLGADHPSTLNSMHNLAFTWKSLGQNVQAIVLLQQCAQQRREVLGANHPDLLSSLTVLAQWDAERAEADLCGKVEGTRLAEG
ncbi:hypothetical protein DPSP01_014460 [Paraphaeosphaeria sporulosa]